jgi:aryl-alcohol dehydrogenase-like predicted oxidoreductase
VIYSEWNGFRLSRLMLGTVQFGMPYGVANRTGQPDYETALAIVDAAVTGGVNCFDTAAAYGTSEQVLGQILHDLKIADKAIVVTKVRALSPDELLNPDQGRRAIEQSILESRRRLQLETLPVVLFHREPDARYLEILLELRERGWLKYCGVSCDNRPGFASKMVAEGHATALQIPANILDHRHRRSGVLEDAMSKNVGIFIRSVYLQGLLLLAEDGIPTHLRDIIPARRSLQAIAENAGMSLAELAVKYMLAQPGVTCLLAGVETVAQVHDNLRLFGDASMNSELRAAIDSATFEISERTLTPVLWSS